MHTDSTLLTWSGIALAAGLVLGGIIGFRFAQPICDTFSIVGALVIAIAIIAAVGGVIWLVNRARW